MVAPLPTRAVVVLSMTATAAEAPTPAVPPKAPLPAIMSISLASSDETMTLPSLFTVAASAISPVVAMFITYTEAEPAMPADPPADSEAATEVMSSLLSASTVTVSRALMLPPTVALVVLSIRPTSAPAPTPPRPPKATAPATPSSFVWSLARTVTSCVVAPSPAGLMVAALPIAAVVVSVRSVTVAEPATPTLPPPEPPAAMVWMSSCEVAVAATPEVFSVSTVPSPSFLPVGTAISPRLPRPVALPSMRASTVLSVISTEADAPMATLPPPETLPARLKRSTSSAAPTWRLPSAIAVEPASMPALTVFFACTTEPEPATPTLLATPPEAEMASMRVVESDLTVMSPAVDSTLVLPLRRASTVLPTSFQANETPTPALSVLAPSAPARPKIRELSVECRAMPAVLSTPSPPRRPAIQALVLLPMVLMVTAPAPAMAPLLAPMAAEMVSMLLSVVASSLMAPVASTSLSSIALSLSLPSLFQLKDRPTPAFPPKAMAPAIERIVESSRALRSTVLTPLSATLSSPVRVVLSISLIDTEPATPSLPLVPATEADRLSILPVTWASASNAPESLTVASSAKAAVVPLSEFCAYEPARPLPLCWVEMVTPPDSALTASLLVAFMARLSALVTLAPSERKAWVSASMSLIDTSAETAMPNLPLPDLLAPAALPLPSWVSLAPAGISVCALLLVASAPATE